MIEIAGKMIMITYEVKQREHYFIYRLLRRCLRSLTTKQQHHQHHNHKQYDTSTRQSILFLSPTSWPEPNATAAGTRTMSLLQHFSPSCPSPPSSTSSSLFHSVHFGCGANLPRLYGKGNNEYDDIQWHRVKPNRSDDMVKLIQKIETENGPVKAVVFDRFYAEEAYSFRIREECPNALRVLDMQDVHSLRVGRQFLVDRHDKSNIESSVDGKYSLMTPQLMDTVMKFDPSMSMLHPWKNENNKEKQKRLKIHDTFLRELASVHRSDLVLVCSSEEMEMLEQKWQIPHWKLVPASFFCSEPKSLDAGTPSFDERTDFVTVGGFKHPPNVDSVNILHKLWPQIRVRLPAAKMHVYGAYPTEKVLSLHDEKNGFLVHGHVEDLDGILKKSRVLLAPLRFGAGIKGKIVDAWRCGCPVITTPVGAEGMRDISHAGVASGSETSWGGRIVKDEVDFVSNTVSMYYDKALWYDCQEQARSLLNTLFDRNKNLTVVDHAINYALINMDDKRRSNLVGSLLWHQNFRSTEYFSKWIELKESNKEKHL